MIAALWVVTVSAVAVPVRIVKPNFGSVVATDSKGNQYPASDTPYDIAQGTELTFSCTPKNDCSVFAEWQCVGGEMDGSNRLVVSSESVTIYARFQIIQYTIEAEVMPTEAGRARIRCGVGSIFLDVAGAVNCGSTVQLTAIEDTDSGFKFVEWDDGVTDRTRLVLADEDRTYIAYFSNPRTPTGVDNTEVDGTTEKYIQNDMLKIRHRGVVYNVQGQRLK